MVAMQKVEVISDIYKDVYMHVYAQIYSTTIIIIINFLNYK